MIINAKRRNVRRGLALLLMLGLMLSSINSGLLVSYAATGSAAYRVGDDVTATLYDGGLLRLSGVGDTWDYAAEDGLRAPFYERRADIVTVEIAAGITSIGDYLFYNCAALSGALTIPETVVRIGDSAFSGDSAGSAPHFRYIFNRFVETDIAGPAGPESEAGTAPGAITALVPEPETTPEPEPDTAPEPEITPEPAPEIAPPVDTAPQPDADAPAGDDPALAGDPVEASPSETAEATQPAGSDTEPAPGGDAAAGDSESEPAADAGDASGSDDSSAGGDSESSDSSDGDSGASSDAAGDSNSDSSSSDSGDGNATGDANDNGNNENSNSSSGSGSDAAGDRNNDSSSDTGSGGNDGGDNSGSSDASSAGGGDLVSATRSVRHTYASPIGDGVESGSDSHDSGSSDSNDSGSSGDSGSDSSSHGSADSDSARSGDSSAGSDSGSDSSTSGDSASGGDSTGAGGSEPDSSAGSNSQPDSGDSDSNVDSSSDSASESGVESYGGASDAEADTETDTPSAPEVPGAGGEADTESETPSAPAAPTPEPEVTPTPEPQITPTPEPEIVPTPEPESGPPVSDVPAETPVASPPEASTGPDPYPLGGGASAAGPSDSGARYEIIHITEQEIGAQIFFPGRTGVYELSGAQNHSFCAAAEAAGYTAIRSWKDITFADTLGGEKTVSVPVTAPGVFLPDYPETGLAWPNQSRAHHDFRGWAEDSGSESPYYGAYTFYRGEASSLAASWEITPRVLIEQTLTAEAGGQRVEVTGNLPEGAELSVETVEVTAAMLGLISETTGTAEPVVYFALDISILLDGEKYQPADYGESVTVSISDLTVTAPETAAILHIDATPQELEAAVADETAENPAVETLLADQATPEEISFTADSFSIYVGIGHGSVIWNGSADYGWYLNPQDNADGSTAATPYIISNARELAGLANLVNGADTSVSEQSGAVNFAGKFLRLADNIYLNAMPVGTDSWQWTPIGSFISNDNKTPFSGSFDGAGYTVSGLYINASAAATPQGLFGYLSGGAVENLTVSGNVTGKKMVGGVVGYLNSSSSVINCENRATVTGTESVGGVVGTAYAQSSISDCANNGDINGNTNVGGITGYTNNVKVYDCANSGDVTQSGDTTSYTGGGIVGFHSNQSTVTNCANYGPVDGAGSYVGGVAGYNSEAFVSNCINLSLVSGSTGVGGIVGNNAASQNNTATVASCYWLDSVVKGIGTSNGTVASCGSFPNVGGVLTAAAGQTLAHGSDLLTALNAYAYHANTAGDEALQGWRIGADGWPVLTGSPAVGPGVSGGGTIAPTSTVEQVQAIFPNATVTKEVTEATESGPTAATFDIELNSDIIFKVDGDLSGAITVQSGATVNIGGGYMLKRGEGNTGTMLTINSGAAVNLRAATLDGGAVWTGDIDPVLGRGTVNSGISGGELISCAGTLDIGAGAVLQNNENTVAATHRAGAVYVTGVVDFSGTVRNCTKTTSTDNTAGNCGGFALDNNAAALTIAGGVITGCSGYDGGAAIAMNGAIITMTDGQITKNKAAHGGGVYVYTSSTMRMSGGVISGNHAGVKGGGIFSNGNTTNIYIWGGEISGNAAVLENNNIYLQAIDENTLYPYDPAYDTSKLTTDYSLDGGLTWALSVPETTVINSGSNLGDASFMARSPAGSAVEPPFDGDMVYYKDGYFYDDEACLADGAIEVSATTGAYPTMAEMLASFTRDTMIYMIDGYTVQDAPETLDGGTHDVYLMRYPGGKWPANTGALLSVDAGQSLTLQNIIVDGGAVWDGWDEVLGRGTTNIGAQAEESVIVAEGAANNPATLTLGSGAVVRNNEKESSKSTPYCHGAGVYAEYANFNIDGGVIADCSLVGENKNGGGVYARESTLNMTSGSVYGCTSQYGRGVFLHNSVMRLNGGSVYNNGANVEGIGGGVYVSTNSILYMHGGSISGNRSNASGGVAVFQNATFYMYGGTIENNKANVGAGMTVYGATQENGGSAHAYLYGGRISGNSAVSNGGGVSVGDNMGTYVNSYVELGNAAGQYPGTVISGNTAKNGGGVYLNAKATMVMHSGEISGNKSTGSAAYNSLGGPSGGGGVFSLAIGVKDENDEISRYGFDMRGGKISGNTSARSGGGVHLYNGATMKLSDGEISGNTVESDKKHNACGGGVSLWSNSVLDMHGGEISDNTVATTSVENHSASGGGVYILASLFNLHGGTISDNTTSSKNYSHRSAGGGVYISATEGQSVIQFNMSGGVISGNTAYTGGACWLGDPMAMSGGHITASNSNSDPSDDAPLHFYTKTSKIILSGGARISTSVKADNTTPRIYVSGPLTGSILVTPSSYEEGTEFAYGNCSELTNLGISNYTLTAADAAAFILTPTGEGAKYYTARDAETNAVEVSTAITGSDNVYLHPTDGEDTSNGTTPTTPVKTLAKAFEKVAPNGTVWLMNTLNVSSTTEISKLSVTIKRYDGHDWDANAGAPASTYSGGNTPFTGAMINLTGTNTALALADITLDGNSNTGNAGIKAYNAANDPDVTVTGSIIKTVAGTTLSIRDGAVLQNNKIQGENNRGGAIQSGTASDNGDGGDIIMYGGTIKDNYSAKAGGGICAYYGSSFTMYRGVIENNTTGSYGGGVMIYASTVKLHGGSICDNTASFGGGGLACYLSGDGSAAITISGGRISDNTANLYGGGVYIGNLDLASATNVTLTISGGEISGNSAAKRGGGIAVYSIDPNDQHDGYTGSATLNLSGGSISGNNATANDAMGGGVYAGQNTALNLSGHAFISGNSAGATGGSSGGNGGGVYVAQNATGMIMAGGEISGNTAYFEASDTAGNTGSGGGVYCAAPGGINGETVTAYGFEMSGGVINGNTAESTVGGGVCVGGGGVQLLGTQDSRATASITGGSISENEADLCGGGVNLKYATLSFGGSASVSDNTASAAGGGFYVYKATLNMTGGEIARNQTTKSNALSAGGGICCTVGGSILNISGGRIVDNKALGTEGNGGGLYVNGANGSVCEVNISDGTVFSGNSAEKHGGGIYHHAYSMLSIAGSSIINNACGAGYNGGGVYIHSVGSANLSLSGDTVITGNTKGTGATATDNNLYLPSVTANNVTTNITAKLTGALTGISHIGFTAEGGASGRDVAVGGASYTVTEDDAKRFFSDETSYKAKYGDGIADSAKKAVITAVTNTVSFDVNETGLTNSPGNTTPTPIHGYVGEVLTLPELMSNADHTFLGWSTTQTGATSGSMTHTVSGATTLYAVWGGSTTDSTTGGNVYIDGDHLTGKTNAGSYGNPVNTFIAAAEILKKNIDDPNNPVTSGTIWFMDNVTIAGDRAGDLSGYNIAVKRFDGHDAPQGEEDKPAYLGHLVTVSHGYTLTLSNITIDGGGASLGTTGSLFYLDGGSLVVGRNAVLQNNVSSGYGGAVRLNSGSGMSVGGGRITGCSAAHGGAVHLGAATLIMGSGSIDHNTATGDGGAVWASDGSTVTMNGGSVEYNTAANGGGLWLAGNAMAELYGCSVRHNNVGATGEGGGVYVNGDYVKLRGGTIITGNTKGEDDERGLNNVYLPEGKALKVTGQLTHSANIGLSPAGVGENDFYSNLPRTVAVLSDGYTTPTSVDQSAFVMDAPGSYRLAHNADNTALELELYINPTTNASVKEGRHISAFSDGGVSVSVPANGIFTMYFHSIYAPVGNAGDRAHALVLRDPLPAGTKITLCEYTDTGNRRGFYHYTVVGTENSIPLSDFKRMGTDGTGENNAYTDPDSSNTQFAEKLVVIVELPADHTGDVGSHNVALNIGETALGAFTVTVTAAQTSAGSVTLSDEDADAGAITATTAVSGLTGQGTKVLALSLLKVEDDTTTPVSFPAGAAVTFTPSDGTAADPTAIHGNLAVLNLGTGDITNGSYAISITGLTPGSYKLQADICVVDATDVNYPLHGSKGSDTTTDALTVTAAPEYALKAELTGENASRVVKVANTATTLDFKVTYDAKDVVGDMPTLTITSQSRSEGENGVTYTNTSPQWTNATIPTLTVTGENQTATATVTVPANTAPGTYRIVFSLGGVVYNYNIIVQQSS